MLSAVLLWSLNLHAQSWNLTGNSGTTPGTNFVGTTDAKALVFKVNNQVSGNIDFSTSKANTSFGFQALNTMKGSYNVALGFRANTLNTTGKNNSSLGAYALYNNTKGYSNVAIGVGALYRNTTPNNTVAIGDSALYNQNYSVFLGEPYGNTAVGSKASYKLVSGWNNTVVGFNAMYTNNGGHDNTAIGVEALFNDVGCYGCNTGAYNVASGLRSMYNNTDGYGNTASGTYTLVSNYTGRWLGAFGYGVDVNADGYFNSTAIGAFSDITASYQVRLGDNTITSIGGYVNWTNVSDVRVKRNIKENVPGLEFINKLKAITYNLDLTTAEQLTHKNVIINKDGKQTPAREQNSKNLKEQILYSGFSAQDVEKAAKELNYNFSGVDAPKNDKDLYGLRYAEFVVPLVKAVQELSTANDQKDQLIKALEEKFKDILQQFNELKSTVSQTSNLKTSPVVTLNDPSALQQNIPNPFKGNTVINYKLPNTFSSAQIVVTDNSGKNLKLISLTKGSTQVTLSAGFLPSGSYRYTLIIDGLVIQSKSMDIL